MTDEQRRIRSYLEAQAAKLAPTQIIDKVLAAMADLRAAAEAIPPGRFDARPAPDDWSANEVMAHVVSAGAHFGGQITRVLDGQPPRSERGESDDQNSTRTLGDWWSLLERDRAALFDRVRRADPEERLDARIDHGMFGPLNWRETLLFMRLHDLDHVGQLQKIAARFAGG